MQTLHRLAEFRLGRNELEVTGNVSASFEQTLQRYRLPVLQ